MKQLIISLSLLFSLSAFAKGMMIEFSCDNSATRVINVFINDRGAIEFEPDIAKDSSLICLKKFQQKVRENIPAFKAQNCSGSNDKICTSPNDSINSKVTEKIKTRHNQSKAASAVPSVPTVSPQTELRSKIRSGQIDPKNLNQTFNFQGKEYKVSDFDDVIGENIESMFMKMSREEAKQFTQNYLTSKSQILASKTPRPEKAGILTNLEKMFGYVHGQNATAELTKAIECLPPDETIQPIRDILGKLEQTRNVASCAPLSPGQHKVFNKDNQNYYSTGNYTLKRKSDGNYQAILNVNFKAGAGSVSPQEMFNRSKACLAEASPHMKGPNGELMELVLMSPDEARRLPAQERPNPYDVTVERPNFKTNAGAYAETVKCDTITHEMLHLLGLCDEYKEDRPEFAQYGWTCRVVTKAPSIMRDLSDYRKAVGGTLNCNCESASCRSIMNGSDQYAKHYYTEKSFYEISNPQFRTKYCKEEALKTSTTPPNRAIGVAKSEANLLIVENRQVYTTLTSPYYARSDRKITCRCPAGDSSCTQELSVIARDAQTPKMRDTCPREASYMSNDPGNKGTSARVEGNVLKIGYEPEIPSLLQPNHFNKILEGNCPGKADGYRECAEFAYKGEPCNVPDRCRDDRHYLGTRQ